MKMRIFMVCETLSEETAQTTQLIEVATSLKRFGHEILLFAPTIRKYTGNKRFNIKYVPTMDIFMLRLPIYQFFLFIYMLIYYLKFKPNLVYTRMGVFSIAPVLFSKIFGLPHVLHLADDIVENMKINNVNPVLITIYKVIEKISCSNSSRITTAHSRVKDIIHERNNILLNKIVLIPNGANIDAFKPMSIIRVRKELNLEDDKFYIGFVGGLDRW
ncbi:MAG: glycosyltransferase, partial [Candidatus Atribacteria bacterium]|nr:glycosyltransferase [Candidatus Atribacteria bacterium]